MKDTKEMHDAEVRGILREHGCMDSLGRVRRWKAEIVEILKAEGHDSLDPFKCSCCNK